MNRLPARYNITEYCPDVRLLFDPAVALIYGGLFFGVAAIFSSRSAYHHKRSPPLSSRPAAAFQYNRFARETIKLLPLPTHGMSVWSL